MTKPGFPRQLCYSAACLALCMVLPFLTGQMQQMGNALCPMHIPVFLAGFLCGPIWAACVGAAAPLLRYALFGMPPIYPIGAAMSFELLFYGLISGLVYVRLPKNTQSIYISLISAMLAGRIVWGAARLIFAGVSGGEFTWAMFLSGAFVTAVPGIILHIVLIPLLVMAFRKAGVCR